jgi:hypothetical protein
MTLLLLFVLILFMCVTIHPELNCSGEGFILFYPRVRLTAITGAPPSSSVFAVPHHPITDFGYRHSAVVRNLLPRTTAGRLNDLQEAARHPFGDQ